MTTTMSPEEYVAYAQRLLYTQRLLDSLRARQASRAAITRAERRLAWALTQVKRDA